MNRILVITIIAAGILAFLRYDHREQAWRHFWVLEQEDSQPQNQTAQYGQYKTYTATAKNPLDPLEIRRVRFNKLQKRPFASQSGSIPYEFTFR